MNLTPREKDKLLVSVAAMVARGRLARGVKLNHPEAIALITDFVVEGATKFVEYVVEGARDDESARKIARTITDSSLVKTAIFGHDPNWGRIMGAAGRAGVDFDPDKVDLSISAGETVPILKDGQPVKVRRSTLAKRMKESFLKVNLDLHEGSGRAVSWGTDLSYEYVRINAEYTT